MLKDALWIGATFSFTRCWQVQWRPTVRLSYRRTDGGLV